MVAIGLTEASSNVLRHAADLVFAASEPGVGAGGGVVVPSVAQVV